eukprot:GHVL01031634.1.p1 GENE.GHVL01031634.1~~GHVL01031634.1.p1  ORF type:complete len:227 (+),score=32.39 GHVL01031634.1:64-744(+)
MPSAAQPHSGAPHMSKPRSVPKSQTISNLVNRNKATLGSGNLPQEVKCPEGVDRREWLAAKIHEIFNEVNLIWDGFSGFCDENSCPVMNAGPYYEYMWADGKDYPKPVAFSAPKYVDLLFKWIDDQLADSSIFPVDEGAPWPGDFESRVKNVFKRLFRVYAHIYHAHWQQIAEMQMEAHMKHSFKHFILVVKEFNLIEDKELEPLKKVIVEFLNQLKPAEQPIAEE